MLVKTFEIRCRYLHGFDNPQTVVIEVVDVDNFKVDQLLVTKH